MAKIPDYTALGQSPTPQPSLSVVPLRTTSGAETAPGEALARVGSQMEGEGEKLYHVAKVEQEKQDTLRAEDAFNQLRDRGLDLMLGEKGFMGVKGADAVNRPLFKDYTAQLDEASKKIAEGLGSDDQRVKFQQRAAVGMRQFQENLLKHVVTERQQYEKQVFDGTLNSELNSIGAQYSDPNAFGLSITRMFAAAEKDVERSGMTSVPGALDSAKQAVLDKAWKARLDAWQVTDPVGAYAAFQENSNQISPAMRLHLKGQLAGNALPAIAAQEVSGNAPVVRQLAPLPGAPLPGPEKVGPQVEKYAAAIDANAQQFGVDPGVMRRQLQVESAGNPAARNDRDIRVTGSPSIGIAQFQPATAQRYGIDPTDAIQSIRGQGAYMGDLLKMFDGDYQKALAGYNWGEGNVQKAVAKYGDKWIDHAPASTQAYVRKIVGADQRGPDVEDLRAAPGSYDPATWGKRQDGTAKGNGFLGVLRTPQGKDVASEYTVGVQINGKEMDVPSLVPTLTRAEVQEVLRAAGDPTGKTKMSNAIYDKAEAFARERVAAGKSVFADEPGQPANGRATDYATMTPGQLLAVKTGNPVIDAMPADDKLRVMGLIHSEALRQRQEKQALLGTREQDAKASFYVNGTAANAPTAGELVDAYGPVDGMKRARSLDEARTTGQSIQQMSTLPTSEIQRVLAQKPAEGDGFAERQKAYELKVAAAQRIVTARQGDPVAYALSTKAYGIQPLNEQMLKDPAALSTELRARAAAAGPMSRDYGTVPQLLTKAEGTAISSVLKQSPVPAQKQYLAALFNGTGDMNAYKGLLQSVAPDAPTLAIAGVFQARQYQSEGTDRGRRDVSDLILRGHAILNPPQKEDGGEHIGGKALVKMPKDDEMRLAFNSYVGDAFKDKEKAKDSVWQAAREIYAARISEEGDDTGNLSAARWKSAIELATGGVEKHKGASIVLPYGVPYDAFRDQVERRSALLAPQAVKASAGELANLPLENQGDGRYVFRRGAGYVIDQQGKPLVMDFNVSEPPALKQPNIAGSKLDVQPFAVSKGGAVTGKGR